MCLVHSLTDSRPTRSGNSTPVPSCCYRCKCRFCYCWWCCSSSCPCRARGSGRAVAVWRMWLHVQRITGRSQPPQIRAQRQASSSVAARVKFVYEFFGAPWTLCFVFTVYNLISLYRRYAIFRSQTRNAKVFVGRRGPVMSPRRADQINVQHHHNLTRACAGVLPITRPYPGKVAASMSQAGRAAPRPPQ